MAFMLVINLCLKYCSFLHHFDFDLLCDCLLVLLLVLHQDHSHSDSHSDFLIQSQY